MNRKNLSIEVKNAMEIIREHHTITRVDQDYAFGHIYIKGTIVYSIAIKKLAKLGILFYIAYFLRTDEMCIAIHI